MTYSSPVWRYVDSRAIGQAGCKPGQRLKGGFHFCNCLICKNFCFILAARVESCKALFAHVCRLSPSVLLSVSRSSSVKLVPTRSTKTEMSVNITCFWCLQGGQSPGGGRGQPDSRVCRACNPPKFACCSCQSSETVCNGNTHKQELSYNKEMSLQAAGAFGQRTRFLPLPQSAISSNHNQRGQAKASTLVPLPSPSSAARARSQPQPATQATKPASVLPKDAPTAPNVRPLQPQHAFGVAMRYMLCQQHPACHLYASTHDSRHSQCCFQRSTMLICTCPVPLLWLKPAHNTSMPNHVHAECVTVYMKQTGGGPQTCRT